LLLLNAHHEPIPFNLPAARDEQHWDILLDTASAQNQAASAMPAPGTYPLQGRSLVVLRTQGREEGVPVVTPAQTATLIKEQPLPKQPRLEPVGG
jgi:glycogen operon protein